MNPLPREPFLVVTRVVPVKCSDPLTRKAMVLAAVWDEVSKAHPLAVKVTPFATVFLTAPAPLTGTYCGSQSASRRTCGWASELRPSGKTRS